LGALIMPTFDTPRPVTARIDVPNGPVRVRAENRDTTSVEVRPGNPRDEAAVQAAHDTRVEFTDGALLITAPRRPRLLFFGGGPSIEVDVRLPVDSSVEIVASAGDVDCEGALGDIRASTKYGDIRVDRAAAVQVRTAAGDVDVSDVSGDAEAATSYGGIRVGRAGGDLRLDTAYGDITVDRADSSVSATTKYGQIRLGQARRGSLLLETAYGGVEIGVREGTAAWLDVTAASGRVRNLLTASEGPEDAAETVQIRARTGHGNVVIRRG
jgi:DUF4097 and DUF4098 domain-containing protein YvlB